MAYLTIGQQIIQILKQHFSNTEIVAFFWGDPHLIGKSSLPAIVVEESGADTDSDYTQMDTEKKTIVIKIIYDKRADWGISNEVDTTFAKIHDFIDGRDPTTGQYLPNSLKGILRSNFTLSNGSVDPSGPAPYAVNQTMRTRYYIEPRPEDTYTQEGHLTMTVTELVIVPNRT